MNMNRLSNLAAVFLGCLVITAFVAPWLSPHDPASQDLASRLLPPFWYASGSLEYPLGTDQLGRDVLTRTLFGARISVFVGLTAASVAAVFGLTVGIAAGFYQNNFDRFISTLIDIQLALPLLLLAVVVVGIFGPSLVVIIATLAFWGWATIGRVARAETASQRDRQFIEASHILGASSFRLMFFHILPNVLPSAVVLWTVAIGQMIVLEGALSFIGLGLSPPTATWGNMLNEGREVLNIAWWVATIPGVYLVLTVMAINSVGDSLVRSLDPRGRIVADPKA